MSIQAREGFFKNVVDWLSRLWADPWLKKVFLFRLEYCALMILYYILKAFPLDRASKLGGKLFTLLGPIFVRIKRHDVYFKKDVKAVFPTISDHEIHQLSLGMFDNLGRNFAEIIHGKTLLREQEKRIRIVNLHNLESVKSRGCIFVSGHFGNWEILIGTAQKHELSCLWLYKELRNPYAEAFIRKIRKKAGSIPPNSLIRGNKGLLEILSALRQEKSLGLLSDQRLNSGVRIDFCGRKAWTNPLPAYVHLRLGYPIVPVLVERVEGVQFQITVYPPMERGERRYSNQALEEVLGELNGIFESWLRQNPSQWLWLNNRWRA